NFGDGNISADTNPTHQYTSDGNYTCTLAVTDAGGDTEDTTTIITVTPAKPTAKFAVDSASNTECHIFKFTDNSDSDGCQDITGYLWNFGDGNISADTNPTHQYTNEGDYTCTLTITDFGGDTEDTTTTITVTDVAPVAKAGDDVTVFQGASVELDGSSSVIADCDTATYDWDFEAGDGLTYNDATNDSTPIYNSNTWGSGVVTLKVTDSDGTVDTDQLTVTVTTDELNIDTTSLPLPNGTEGTAYSETVSASGGTTDYTWSIHSGILPPGLNLTSGTPEVTIAGTPTTAGTYSCILQVTDSTLLPDTQTDTQPISITIHAIPPPVPLLRITTKYLPDGQVDVAYLAEVTATGGTGSYFWSASGLPSGLSINSSTGDISGTPTTEGDYTATVQVSSGGQTDSRDFPLTINPASESDFPNFPAGWSLMSVPVEPVDPSASAVIGDDVTGDYYLYDAYDNASGSYSPSSEIHMGGGHWLWLKNPATVDVDGASASGDKTVSLAQGWTMIGTPSSSNYNFFLNATVTKGGVAKSLWDAALSFWIYPYLFAYNSTTETYYETLIMLPWNGYFFYAFESGCTLTMSSSPPSLPPGPAPARTLIARAAAKLPHPTTLHGSPQRKADNARLAPQQNPVPPPPPASAPNPVPIPGPGLGMSVLVGSGLFLLWAMKRMRRRRPKDGSSR
ncbi:MAG: PKD domain-containing protein, partial [bacterium]|nr:PKD domain-containing protein [bacterium]